MRKEKSVVLSLIIFLALLAPPVFADEGISLTPYRATYAFHYRGFKAGLIHFTLSAQAENTYTYTTRVEPGLLARLVVNPDAVEQTVLQIDDNGVRPLSWTSEDGKASRDKDGRLLFDWAAQRVSGTVEGQTVTLPTRPDLQNRLSMQIAVLFALLQDKLPAPITLIDGNRVKLYSYAYQKELQLDTAAGRFDVVLYESTRQGSSRLKRIYHAPALGYLPVRLETLRKGKRDSVLELVSLSPAEGPGLVPVEPNRNTGSTQN
ncbi:MAG: hypothetical protein C0614_14370 [Desulfuromonas sp.]|nr:MAG: hypothetical protein C0614_14370 [Desulfuromonas sp.]